MFNYYQRPSAYYDAYPSSHYPQQSSAWGYPQQYRRPMVDPEEAQARARALAAQRARRAQWLPDEDDEPEDDWEYNSLPPRERMLVEAARRRQQLEQQQRQQEYARQRAVEEARWQEQLEQRQKEEDERRQRLLEQQRRIQQQKREREEARRRAEAERQQGSPLPSSTVDTRIQSNKESLRHLQSRIRSPSQQRQSPSPSPSKFRVPINDHSPSRPSRRPQTPPPKPPTPRPQYDERHEEAASKIQTQYRIYRSFQTINNLEREFKDAQRRFTFPAIIDFQRPGHELDAHISVPVSRSPDAVEAEDVMDVDGQPEGKLAYTSNNYGLNAFLESMLKLLTKLDGVESWGEKGVREKRRSVVKVIEKEMGRIDGYWKGAWRDYLAAQRQRQEQGKTAQADETEVKVEGGQPIPRQEEPEQQQAQEQQQEGEPLQQVQQNVTQSAASEDVLTSEEPPSEEPLSPSRKTGSFISPQDAADERERAWL